MSVALGEVLQQCRCLRQAGCYLPGFAALPQQCVNAVLLKSQTRVARCAHKLEYLILSPDVVGGTGQEAESIIRFPSLCKINEQFLVKLNGRGAEVAVGAR